MNIKVNGENITLETTTKIISLKVALKKLGYDHRTIVVEYNGVILPSNKWKDQQLVEGDRLEIVTIVGGGS